MKQIYGPYAGWVREVHDGDTVFVDLDLGFGTHKVSKDWDGRSWLSCRVQAERKDGTITGINSPELRFPAGKQARDYARTILPVGTRVTVRSTGWDKFGGRFDGLITLPDGRDFGAVMVDEGMAEEKVW